MLGRGDRGLSRQERPLPTVMMSSCASSSQAAVASTFARGPRQQSAGGIPPGVEKLPRLPADVRWQRANDYAIHNGGRLAHGHVDFGDRPKLNGLAADTHSTTAPFSLL